MPAAARGQRGVCPPGAVCEAGAAAIAVTSACLSPQRWTETYVRWSPKGTYLATFHQRGIALWGGEKFKQIQRFSHQGVQLIDFSPCER